MIALIQRVRKADVSVENEVIGKIDQGLVVLLGVEKGDTNSGTRPSFSTAAAPADAKHLYAYFVGQCHQQQIPTATGRFAADMQVSLVNDGPVTFWLQV